MGKDKKGKKKRSGPRLRKDLVQRPEVVKKSWLESSALYLVCLLCTIVFFMHINYSDYGKRKAMLTFDESVYARLGFYIKDGQDYSTAPIYYDSLKIGRKLPEYVKDPLFKHPPAFAGLIRMTYAFIDKRPTYQFKELYRYAVKVPALMGSLLILLIFLVGRKLYDYRIGLLAAILFAIELNRWICSERLWIASTLTFFMWLSLYFYLLGSEKKWFLYPAGVCAGVALLSKYPAVLIFPILITYVLIYARHLLKLKSFYISLLLAGAIFSPWLLLNFKVYGEEAYQMMVLSQTAAFDRFDMFANLAYVILPIIAVIAFLIKKKEAFQSQYELLQSKAPYVLSTLAILLVLGLIVQKDFFSSLITSLSWSGIPKAGWEIGMFQEEPKYFYLKQFLEYSPFYLLFLVALTYIPFGKKSDVFLFMVAFWTLSFGIIYGDYQGRYMLYFSPAAILLIGKMMILFYDKLIEKNTQISKILLYSGYVLTTYFLIKTLRVDYLVAIKDNVAYF